MTLLDADLIELTWIPLNRLDCPWNWLNWICQLLFTKNKEETFLDELLTAFQEGAWNKIGIINKLLKAYKPEDVEWILWMEPDAIFDNPAFTFPFEHYQGKNIITVADAAQVSSGESKGMTLEYSGVVSKCNKI